MEIKWAKPFLFFESNYLAMHILFKMVIYLIRSSLYALGAVGACRVANCSPTPYPKFYFTVVTMERFIYYRPLYASIWHSKLLLITTYATGTPSLSPVR